MVEGISGRGNGLREAEVEMIWRVLEREDKRKGRIESKRRGDGRVLRMQDNKKGE